MMNASHYRPTDAEHTVRYGKSSKEYRQNIALYFNILVLFIRIFTILDRVIKSNFCLKLNKHCPKTYETNINYISNFLNLILFFI